MNRLALTSLLCVLIFPPLAVIFGHIALREIKRYGQDGREAAIAGLVLGYLLTVLYTVVAIYVVLVLISFLETAALLWFISFSWLKPS
jgi:peptidyl-prolyl cis-trans isomerase B (cyclophilin B)